MHFTSGSASLGHYEYSMCESESPNDGCSLNRSEMEERNKSGGLQHFFSKENNSFLNCFAGFSSPSLFCFLPVCSSLLWASFDAPWQWLWSINHLFPELSVPACTEMKQQPLDHRHGRFQPSSARLSCQTPHTQQSNAALVLHRHFKPSGLFSGEVQIKHY